MTDFDFTPRAGIKLPHSQIDIIEIIAIIELFQVEIHQEIKQ